MTPGTVVVSRTELAAVRYGIWTCRIGTVVIGVMTGCLYLVGHTHLFRQDDHGMYVPTDPHADAVALGVVVGVACWLLASLVVAERVENPRARWVPGLALGAMAAAVVLGSSRVDAWPIAGTDAALILGIGSLGSLGVLVVPGSLRTNPWARARVKRH